MVFGLQTYPMNRTLENDSWGKEAKLIFIKYSGFELSPKNFNSDLVTFASVLLKVGQSHVYANICPNDLK